MQKKILLVEDESAIREMMKFAFLNSNYTLLEAEDAEQAQLIITNKHPDLILLDWMLPGISGIELAKRLKQDASNNEIPIIMLTARGDEVDRIRGFAVGIDDYICFDNSTHRISIQGNCINLGPTEYKLLHFFLTHTERVYSREQLLDHVWGGDVYIEERTVDVHIRRLRKALAQFNADHLVQTVRGSGYRFSTV